MFGLDVADVLDGDLRLDGERILIRHDVEDLLAALNDAADRKHRERHHPPGIGRADFHAAEHGLGIHRLRDHLEHLGLGVAQVLGDVSHSVIVELGDLLLLLGDRLAGLGDVGVGVRNLALKAESGALQLQDARPRDQPSLDQRRDVFWPPPGPR